MSDRHVVPESTTEVYYPKSKRRIIFDHSGKIVSDKKEKEKNE
jgi:hypothetical protein